MIDTGLAQLEPAGRAAARRFDPVPARDAGLRLDRGALRQREGGDGDGRDDERAQ